MNSTLVVCFLLSVTVAGIHCRESCGFFRRRFCEENECCLFGLFCRPIRRENQRCGSILHCPCAPGLECANKGSRGRRVMVCRVPTNSTTTSTMSPMTTSTMLPPGINSTDTPMPPTMIPPGINSTDTPMPPTIDETIPPEDLFNETTATTPTESP